MLYIVITLLKVDTYINIIIISNTNSLVENKSLDYNN